YRKGRSKNKSKSRSFPLPPSDEDLSIPASEDRLPGTLLVAGDPGPSEERLRSGWHSFAFVWGGQQLQVQKQRQKQKQKRVLPSAKKNATVRMTRLSVGSEGLRSG